MTTLGRYDTTGLEETESEPGSNGMVLKNRLGITTSAAMEQAETLALLETTERMLDRFDQSHQFSSEDIQFIHREWLGGIYSWAGSYRQVMMSKKGFPFAAPQYLPALMMSLEKEILSRYTPCHGDDATVATALAIVHVELVLVHPFREGNGRLARLLAMLMGLQAGLPLLIFDAMDGEGREPYFSAIHSGMDHDYLPMTLIFQRIIEQSRSEG